MPTSASLLTHAVHGNVPNLALLVSHTVHGTVPTSAPLPTHTVHGSGLQQASGAYLVNKGQAWA